MQPGSADLCFITDHKIDDVLRGWKGAGIEVSVLLSEMVLLADSSDAGAGGIESGRAYRCGGEPALCLLSRSGWEFDRVRTSRCYKDSRGTSADKSALNRVSNYV